MVVELCGYKQTSTRKLFSSILEILDSIDYVKGVVAKENKWHPNQVDELEFQDTDYRGLFWWYNSILTDIADENKRNTK